MKLVAPHRRRAPGESLPGWDQWVEQGTPAGVAAVPPEAMAAAIAARGTSAPPPRAPELGRWDSFKALCRQQWDPPDADERPLRRVAGLIAVGWHLFIGIALVWLMYQQFLAPAHAPRKGQEDVVQVEFIGDGTPADVGGGAGAEPAPAQTPQDAVPASSALVAAPQTAIPTPAASQPPQSRPEPVETPLAVAQPAVPASEPEPEPVPEPVAQPSPPEVSQAVEVSAPVPDADTDYVLPPPMPRLQLPQVTVPDRTLPAPEVSVVELPRHQAPSLPAIAPRPVAGRALEQAVPEVQIRDIPTPLPAAPATTIAPPAIAISERPLTTQPIREREIPASPAPSSPPETSAASAETPTSASEASTVAGTSGAAAAPDTVATTAGPRPDAAPGGLASPVRSDDWGDSTREITGGQKGDPSGLYNSDGSIRLATTPGSASPGRPPGTVTDEIVNLDRAGTWLKRAPTDYEPTAFDRYWRPSETLLEEWVRKSVTTVRIPIPGTNKHVVCTTILLVVGGACDITDPNLLDIPPTARPAPDVPFKPDLQEGNGSLPAPVE